MVQAVGNPFLDKEMNERWYNTFVSTPDADWNVSTKDTSVFPALYGKQGTFTQAGAAMNWLLDYVHPQSPLMDKPELLLRAMRRIDGYMDDCHNGKPTGNLYHFFALGPALASAVTSGCWSGTNPRGMTSACHIPGSHDVDAPQ